MLFLELSSGTLWNGVLGLNQSLVKGKDRQKINAPVPDSEEWDIDDADIKVWGVLIFFSQTSLHCLSYILLTR